MELGKSHRGEQRLGLTESEVLLSRSFLFDGLVGIVVKKTCSTRCKRCRRSDDLCIRRTWQIMIMHSG